MSEDFLSKHGMRSSAQFAAVRKASAEASSPKNMAGDYPYYKVSNSIFDRMPCRDCTGTKAKHDSTCPSKDK